jgi:ribosomal protein S3
MGQKVHPEIFKLSKTAGWKSKYIERKKINLGLHAGKDIAVKTFIKHFFTRIGFDIHNCKISYFNHRLNILISYTKNNKLIQGIELFVTAQKTSNKNKKNDFIKKSLKAKIRKIFFILLLYNTPFVTRQVNNTNTLNTTKFFIKKKIAKKHFQISRTLKLSEKLSQSVNTRKLKELKFVYYKTHLVGSSPDSNSILKKEFLNRINFNIAAKVSIKRTFLLVIKSLNTLNPIIENKIVQNLGGNFCKYKFTTLFCKILSLFLKKTLKITLIFKALNRSIKKTKPKIIKKILKKKLFSLRKYKRNKFFKKGLNLMLLLVSQKESASVIASYVSSTLKNFKKHKLFLNFMKKTLYIFSKQKKTVIKALKIQLKGRINGADRARHYVIKVGNQLSLMTTSSRINYSESTAFTPDGTLSIKVWVKYRKNLTQLKSKRYSQKSIGL